MSSKDLLILGWALTVAAWFLYALHADFGAILLAVVGVGLAVLALYAQKQWHR